MKLLNKTEFEFTIVLIQLAPINKTVVMSVH